MQYNTNIKGLSEDERAVLEALNNRDKKYGPTINPFETLARQQAGTIMPLRSGVTPVINKFWNWLNTDNSGDNRNMEAEFNASNTSKPKQQTKPQQSVAVNKPKQTQRVVQQSTGGYQLPTLPTIDNNKQATEQLTDTSQQIVPKNINELLEGYVEQAEPITNPVMDYYNSRQQDMDSYVDTIKNFLDNYGKYQKIYDDLDTYYRGLAGWTGNQAWANYAQSHNPVDIEKTKLALYSDLAKQQIANKDKLYEIIANERMAEALGLPVGSSLASKTMIQDMNKLNRAKTVMALKEESKKLDRQLKEQELAFKYYKANGDWANARRIAEMNNAMRIKAAQINASIWNLGGGVVDNMGKTFSDGKTNL